MSSAFSAVVAEEGRDDVREDGRDEDGPPPPPSIEAAVGMAGVDGCRTEEEFGRGRALAEKGGNLLLKGRDVFAGVIMCIKWSGGGASPTQPGAMLF
jgi:hypothetical protein